jgi:hypothetical protein
LQYAHQLFHEPNFKRTVPTLKKSPFRQRIFCLPKVRFGTVREKFWFVKKSISVLFGVDDDLIRIIDIKDTQKLLSPDSNYFSDSELNYCETDNNDEDHNVDIPVNLASASDYNSSKNNLVSIKMMISFVNVNLSGLQVQPVFFL